MRRLRLDLTAFEMSCSHTEPIPFNDEDRTAQWRNLLNYNPLVSADWKGLHFRILAQLDDEEMLCARMSFQ
jgi:hypothetical protein